MTPEFLEGFIVKEIETKDGNGEKATIWFVQEKNGTYQVTGLFKHSIMWELEHLYNSRKQRI